MNTLSLDLGLKHVGVAIADQSNLASGLTTLNYQNKIDLINQIKEIIKTHHINQLVIGIPKNGVIKELAKDLESYFSPDVVLYPEDYSSLSAIRAQVEANKSKLRRQKQQHQAAAAAILQSYLEDPDFH